MATRRRPGQRKKQMSESRIGLTKAFIFIPSRNWKNDSSAGPCMVYIDSDEAREYMRRDLCFSEEEIEDEILKSSKL